MDKKTKELLEEFHQGSALSIYEVLGAHRAVRRGKHGYIFRTWAPEAKAVYVCGDFNQWGRDCPMERVTEKGVWEAFVPNLEEYDLYKFCILDKKDEAIMKADPYGFHMEVRPGTASKLCHLDKYAWGDGGWKLKSPYQAPMNIYEVHLGSWRRYADENYFDYRKIAEELVPYVKEMGYTHIEIMPINEYPFDGSWGYQIVGYYAPTSRYGEPKDFMYFVDHCHQNGIGVIMDWVPGHFPKDRAGLYHFDGGPCYEYKDPLKQEHREWGTMIFDWGRSEVKSFLISNALYWLKEYHIDGLRVDAVASMLYLDYNRKAGQWRPNKNGGKENLEAIAFLQQLNTSAFGFKDNILMIAEESTAWPKVTMPVDVDGLGFNFKWNMGWMNDSLEYMKTDSLYKKGQHHNMTFSLTYAYSENYILPLSHDEVVHMKGSLANKMPGEKEDQLANLRAYLAYMMTHPGKKLMFMGGELAQFNEWHFEGELDWHLLEEEEHRKFHKYVKDLNHLYLESRELWENDMDWHGFYWTDADDKDRNIFSYRRVALDGSELAVVLNFAPVSWKYRMGVYIPGKYQVLFNSDRKAYGGTGTPVRLRPSSKIPCHGHEQSVLLNLPPLSALILKVNANTKLSEVKR